MAGWSSTAADAVKIGQLVLNNGIWNGQPLIDPAYMREMVGQSQPLTASYGLLWWRRRAQNTRHVDEASLKRLREAGIDKALVDKFAALRDRPFAPGEYRKAATSAMGDDLKVLGAAMAARQINFEDLLKEGTEPIVAYEANGYLGQYIVVVPRARLVAVRQIDGAENTDDKPWPYEYEDFTRRVIDLAHTIEPDLAVNGP